MRCETIYLRISLVLTGLLAVASCTSPGGRVVDLEQPENTCLAEPVSWQGIVPGQSTRQDVIEILGQPSQRGHSSQGVKVFVYPPIMKLASSYGNMIGFRDDDIVDWVDIWVLDSDGQFHTVAEIAQVPDNYVVLDENSSRKILDLMEALEDHDDVQNVYANFDIPPEVMAKIES